MDSESSSLSSVPSEFVSYEVTGDHSYIAGMPADSGDAPGVAPLEQMALSSAGDATASDVIGESKEEFKPPLKRRSKKQLTDKGAENGADEMQSGTNSESQPRCKKQSAKLEKKKRKSQAMNKGRKSRPRLAAEEKKRKSPKVPDEENSTESEEPREKKKTVRLSRYFKYVSEDEYQQFITPNPLIIPKKQLFECVCGKGETESKRIRRSSRKQKHVVMCTECGTSQHAECMHYDLEDPFRGPYKCPHCHYVSMLCFS